MISLLFMPSSIRYAIDTFKITIARNMYMKTLIINGSPRKNGKTATLLKQLADQYATEDEYEWINVYDLTFKPCRSCYGCRPDQ